MTGLTALIVVAVLLVLAAAVYMKLVRDKTGKKKWGLPVCILLLLAAVAAALAPLRPSARRHRFSHVEAVGRQLRGRLSPGAGVLILMRYPPERFLASDRYRRDAAHRQWLGPHAASLEEWIEREAGEVIKALEKGLRFSVNLIDQAGSGPDDVEEMNEALEPYRGQGVDLVVSMVGLPLSFDDGDEESEFFEGGLNHALEHLTLFGWTPAPQFVSVDLLHTGRTFHPEQIRGYIRDGRLAAIALRTAGEDDKAWVVVGPDNLEDMPADSPYGL